MGECDEDDSRSEDDHIKEVEQEDGQTDDSEVNLLID